MLKLLMFITWIWLAVAFFPMIWPAAWPELPWWLIAISVAGVWWAVWEEHFQKTGPEARSKFPPAGWQPREPRPSRKSRHE